jgi:uncharacterized protein involved in cysteine biosynthesis
MMHRDRSLLWVLLISFISALTFSVASVIITGIFQDKNNEKIHQQQIDNNRQWCELLSPLDKAYSSTVPATELGKKVAEAIHKLHNSFEC